MSEPTLKMSDELKAKLKTLGLTEDNITALENAGAINEADLVNPQDIVSVTTCGIFVANRIVRELNPAPAAVVAPAPVEAVPAPVASAAAPMNITLNTGNPDDMTVQDLLTRVRDGERSQDFVQALNHKVGFGRKVFVRDGATDLINVAETMELMNYNYPKGDEPAFWGDQPTETLAEILEIRTYLDPLTGRSLAKGDAWLKLDQDQMAAFAYARIKNTDLITGNEDKYALVNEVLSTPPGERWKRIQTLWNRGLKTNDPEILTARAAVIGSVNKGTNQRDSRTTRALRRSGATIEEGGANGEPFRRGDQ